MNNNNELMTYREAVQKIKRAILQSRYRTVSNGNAEMLSLYYGVGEYISANTRSGKWGTSAIETISEQLQGEIPGLRGFSPTNMKNMRIFFEEWTEKSESNRQLPTAEMSKTKIQAFRREMNRTVVELAVQDYDKPLGVATYRLGTDIPEPYKALIPLIDGVQHIVAENTEPAEEDV